MPEKTADSLPGERTRERLVLFILAAVQFTTIVDFMIVMPLGPQMMPKLDITTAQFSWIVSSYTFAAGAAGLVASSIVDRFARRPAFVILYAGFLLGTLFCALAPSYQLLVVARIVTGAFGGILGGMAMTIIGDVFPEHRRGRATGSLMSGFALASVVGVPLGLIIGNAYGWQAPFIALVIGGAPALFLIPYALPPLADHVGQAHAHPLRSLVDTFSQINHLRAFALIIALAVGSFTVFPLLSTFLVANVGLTVRQLPFLYIVGGGLTLFAAPVIGIIADRFGKLNTYRIIAPISAVLLLTITNLPPVHMVIAVTLFGALMVCNVGRMIAAMAMITSSVEPRRRGGFLSANSSVQHIASGIGASIGGFITSTANVEALEHGAAALEKAPPVEHFGTVGWIAAGATLLSIWLAGRVRIIDEANVSAEKISLAAAAEASVDAGEPLINTVDEA